MIYKISNMDYQVVKSYGGSFGGGKEPNVLSFSRRLNTFISDISRFTIDEDFIYDQKLI
jgi:hypothetical protein